ncbi:tyrosine-type recombinase/integrase [Burkholderia glumae]|uniref:tyrosine-type recombinase/integrase n=1 Tax=Burkholderia glumae TaxID=337 RepID=UPI001374A415|nr:tyrosine-type recombinase/integrase [Burkholderia glumae]
MNTSKRRPISLQRDVADDGQVFWHLSDERSYTVGPFLDYIIDCVDVKLLRPKTVESKAYSLKKWYQFLSEQNVSAFDASDEDLEDFRAALLKRQVPNTSGDKQARLRTINVDLRNVYGYYAWLQQHPSYGRGKRLIGPFCFQITSTLASDGSVPPEDKSDRRRYPLTVPNAGERSKHRLGFVPREEHRAALTEHLYETHALDLARRNCLIFDLAWYVGWRRGSILSLTIDQFDKALIDKAKETITVKPAAQKFGYSNTYDMSVDLAARVRDYIENERKAIVLRTGSKFKEVFLSHRDGSPLKAGTASIIFVAARNALGWPLGAALHAWRRGFTNAYIEREIDARQELGLDTSGETISMSVAIALGQNDLLSQAAYVRDAQRRLKGSVTFRDKEEHARLADENAALRAENARLRRLLG